MITRLQITHLRNINYADLTLGGCNVFVGANGSGKTSLLEAVFLLSRGKSFRHHQPKRYIQHHQPATTVHARLADITTLAIQKQLDATTTLRLNQNTVYTQSVLAQQLPTLLIDPSSMDMLEQGSASRRQLLDWLAFHMKPDFHPQWLAYQRLLKQRNRLLKDHHNLSASARQELKAWDNSLATHAALIHQYRLQVFNVWQLYFKYFIKALLPQYAGQLSLSYVAGYDTQTPLDEQLQARLIQDLQQGYTRIGSHRADVQVYWRTNNKVDLKDYNNSTQTAEDEQLITPITTVNSSSKDVDSKDVSRLKEQAVNVLSRGEKKLLITALKLSQLPLLLTDQQQQVYQQYLEKLHLNKPLHELTANTASSQIDKRIKNNTATDVSKTLFGFTPVVLLDDITAELDNKAVQVLLSALSSLPCQVFITSLTDDVLPIISRYWQQTKMFHVKQGQFSTL